MATETLNIKVTDGGSANKVAVEFKAMARQMKDAGKAYKSLHTAMSKPLKVPPTIANQMKKMGTSTTRARKGFKGLTVEVGFANTQFNILSKKVNMANVRFAKTSTAADKAAKGVRRAGNAAKDAASDVKTMSKRLTSLRSIMFALGISQVVRGFLSMSDSMQNMDNRIRLVTNSTGEFNEVQGKLFGIAKNTRQSLSATVETYVRLRKATESQGISQERLMGSLTTLNKMLAVSGATSIEAEQGMRQLSQAFSKGKFDGDEFRGVSEALPDILTALEKSLGVTRGELRAMSEAGQLTTEVMIEAFEAIKDTSDANFAGSVTTFSQAWIVLKDEVLKTVGAMNKSTGLIGGIITAMQLLSNNMWIAVTAVKALVLWLGFKLVKAIVTSRKAMVTNMKLMVASARATSASLLALALTNPFTAIIAGAVIATGVVLTFKDALGDLGDSIIGLNDTDKQTSAMDSAVAQIQHTEKLIALLEKKARLEKPRSGEQGVRVKNLRREIAALTERNEGNLRYLAHLKSIEEVEVRKEAAQVATKKQTESYKKLIDELFRAKKATEEYTAATRVLTEMSKDDTLATEARLAQIALTKKFREDTSIDEVLRKQNSQIDVLKMSTKAQEKHNRSLKAYEDALDTIQKKLGAGGAQGLLSTPMGQAKFLNIMANNLKIAKGKDGNKGKGRGRKDTTLADLQKLLAQIDKVTGAEARLTAQHVLLNKAVRRGLIDQEAATVALDHLIDISADARDPWSAFTKEAEANNKALFANTKIAERAAWIEERVAALTEKTGEAYRGKNVQLVEEAELRRHKAQMDAAAIARQAKIVSSVLQEEDAIKQLTDQFKELEKARTRTKDPLSRKDEESEKIKLLPKLEKNLRAIYAGLDPLHEAQMARFSIAQDHLAMEKEIQKAQALGLTDAAAKALRDLNDRERGKATKDLGDSGIEGTLKLGDFSAAGEDMFSQQELVKQQIQTQTVAWQAFEEAGVSAMLAIGASMGEFLVTGKVDWEDFTESIKDLMRDFVDTMLEALARLLIKQALVASFGAPTAAPTAPVVGELFNAVKGKRHGGSHTVRRELPHFAHGGQFQVGGRSGPDKQLVQFMASPGENVKVTNPGQSRLDDQEGTQQAAAPVVNVQNFMDPEMIPAAMASPQGQQAVMNIISANGRQIRRLLK